LKLRLKSFAPPPRLRKAIAAQRRCKRPANDPAIGWLWGSEPHPMRQAPLLQVGPGLRPLAADPPGARRRWRKTTIGCGRARKKSRPRRGWRERRRL